MANSLYVDAQMVRAKDTVLNEVVISYKANSNTPVTFQALSGSELKARSTGQEPSYLLAETPSITVYSDDGNTQGYSYFRLRGIDQTRVNMTLDGVPLNEPEDQGAYFSNYPDIANSLSSLQVQRGVGTSKNGTSSFGGSVQLFSPLLQDSCKTTFGIAYGSFNTYRAFGEYNSGLKRHMALYARASELHSDGYKYHSSNTSRSLYLSAGLFYNKTTWKINLIAGHQQNELAWLGVTDSLIARDRRTNANSTEKDNFNQYLLQLYNSWNISDKLNAQSCIYYTHLDGNYDMDLNNYLGLPSTGELYNYAVFSGLTGFFNNYTYSTGHFRFTGGVNGNTYFRTHTGSDNLLGRLYRNTGYKNELSAFTKVEYTAGCFTLFADVQYRYTSFSYKGDVPFAAINWRFINPKSGITLAVTPTSNLYYSIGKAGREPTRTDIFGGNDNLLTDSTGKPSLFITHAEYVTDHELGFRNRRGKINLNCDLYYMSFKNEIVLDGKFGPNGLALTDVAERSFRSGIELFATYKASTRFLFTNNSSFNYSRISEQGVTFVPVLTPALIINQECEYILKRCSFALSGRYQQQSYIDFANTAFVKSYVLFNVRAHYDIGRFQLAVFLYNITNVKYINNGYVDTDGSRKYFVQAPVNYSASIKYSF